MPDPATVRHYRNLLRMYPDPNDSHKASQWSSKHAQTMRFQKLSEIADLSNRSVLDIGCGLGDLYEFLCGRFKGVTYTGVDIVPELIKVAFDRHPEVRFVCTDILANNYLASAPYDYVLISGVFNNRIPHSDQSRSPLFLSVMVAAAFQLCVSGLAFNFISARPDPTNPEYTQSFDITYHDPTSVFALALSLTHRTVMWHGYEAGDVCVWMYKT